MNQPVGDETEGQSPDQLDEPTTASPGGAPNKVVALLRKHPLKTIAFGVFSAWIGVSAISSVSDHFEYVEKKKQLQQSAEQAIIEADKALTDYAIADVQSEEALVVAIKKLQTSLSHVEEYDRFVKSHACGNCEDAGSLYGATSYSDEPNPNWQDKPEIDFRAAADQLASAMKYADWKSVRGSSASAVAQNSMDRIKAVLQPLSDEMKKLAELENKLNYSVATRDAAMSELNEVEKASLTCQRSFDRIDDKIALECVDMVGIRRAVLLVDEAVYAKNSYPVWSPIYVKNLGIRSYSMTYSNGFNTWAGQEQAVTFEHVPSTYVDDLRSDSEKSRKEIPASQEKLALWNVLADQAIRSSLGVKKKTSLVSIPVRQKWAGGSATFKQLVNSLLYPQPPAWDAISSVAGLRESFQVDDCHGYAVRCEKSELMISDIPDCQNWTIRVREQQHTDGRPSEVSIRLPDGCYIQTNDSHEADVATVVLDQAGVVTKKLCEQNFGVGNQVAWFHITGQHGSAFVGISDSTGASGNGSSSVYFTWDNPSSPDLCNGT